MSLLDKMLAIPEVPVGGFITGRAWPVPLGIDYS